MKTHSRKFFGFLIFFAVSTSVSAAEIEEIVVTAQKREQNLQDVAMSISALTEESIENLGIDDFRQWADYVPGITMSYGLNSRRGGPIAVIRGVTNQVRGGIGDNTANATTAYTIGEIPVFSVSPAMTDIQRIEALRGPQGTLFGIAAMGGVVRYILNDAQTDQFTAKVSAGAGLIEHGSGVFDGNAVVNIPLVEGVLAVRASGTYQHNGGFIDHIYPRLDQTENLDPTQFTGFDPRDHFGQYEKDTNGKEVSGGRVSLTYTPTDRLTLKASSMRNQADMSDGWQVDFNDPLDLVVNRFVKRKQRMAFKLHSVEAAYAFDLGTLEYITGYYENDLSEVGDATKFMGDQLVDLQGLPFPTTATFPFITHTDQWTHELRLQGQDKSLGGLNFFGSDMTFDYVVGAFYQDERREGGYRIGSPEWNNNLPAGAPDSALIKTEHGLRAGATGGSIYKNKAVFVDLTLHVADSLSIAGGIRWFEQEKYDFGRGWGDWLDTMGVRQPDDLNDADFRPSDNVTHPEYVPSQGGFPRLNDSTVQNDGTTPRATIQYNLDDDKMLFFSAARGQRIGISPPDDRTEEEITENMLPTCEQTIRDLGLISRIQAGTTSDSIWAYDLGIKSVWLEDRLVVNASAFLTDWADLQQVVIVNSVNRSCSEVIQANVGGAEIKGFEIESTYVPTENITLNGSIAFADAEISDAPPGVRDSIGDPLEEGDAITSVPPWTAHFGAQYQFNVPLLADDFIGYIRGDWRYVDERIKGFGDKPSLRAAIPLNVAESYQLTDVRFGLDSEDWSLSLYMSNIFDERAQFESMSNFFQPNLQDVAINQPRTVGFSVSRIFQ